MCGHAFAVILAAAFSTTVHTARPVSVEQALELSGGDSSAKKEEATDPKEKALKGGSEEDETYDPNVEAAEGDSSEEISRNINVTVMIPNNFNGVNKCGTSTIRLEGMDPVTATIEDVKTLLPECFEPDQKQRGVFTFGPHHLDDLTKTLVGAGITSNAELYFLPAISFWVTSPKTAQTFLLGPYTPANTFGEIYNHLEAHVGRAALESKLVGERGQELHMLELAGSGLSLGVTLGDALMCEDESLVRWSQGCEEGDDIVQTGETLTFFQDEQDEMPAMSVK